MHTRWYRLPLLYHNVQVDTYQYLIGTLHAQPVQICVFASTAERGKYIGLGCIAGLQVYSERQFSAIKSSKILIPLEHFLIPMMLMVRGPNMNLQKKLSNIANTILILAPKIYTWYGTELGSGGCIASRLERAWFILLWTYITMIKVDTYEHHT